MASRKNHNTASLASVIRETREDRGISIRELGRRAGVSAGQISRIEAGEVEKPSRETLGAIARALGGRPDPLLVIAGHFDEGREVERLRSAFDQIADEHDTAISAANEFDFQLDDVPWTDPGALDRGDRLVLARRLFTAPVLDPVDFLADDGADEVIRTELRELMRAWPALTPERRRLIRGLLADQEVLSTFERMPNPPGRYEMDVRLSQRNDDGK